MCVVYWQAVEVWGHFSAVCSPLPSLHGLWGLNSDGQPCAATTLPADSSCQLWAFFISEPIKGDYSPIWQNTFHPSNFIYSVPRTHPDSPGVYTPVVHTPGTQTPGSIHSESSYLRPILRVLMVYRPLVYRCGAHTCVVLTQFSLLRMTPTALCKHKHPLLPPVQPFPLKSYSPASSPTSLVTISRCFSTPLLCHILIFADS